MLWKMGGGWHKAPRPSRASLYFRVCRGGCYATGSYFVFTCGGGRRVLLGGVVVGVIVNSRLILNLELFWAELQRRRLRGIECSYSHSDRAVKAHSWRAGCPWRLVSVPSLLCYLPLLPLAWREYARRRAPVVAVFLRSQTVTCKTAPMGNCVSVAGLGWLGSVCGRLIGERVCGRRPSVVCRVTNLTHDCRRYFLFTFSPTVNGLFLDDARKIVLPKVFTARRYASAVYDVSFACLSVCSSVCLSQAGIMPDWLSINNHGKIVIR